MSIICSLLGQAWGWWANLGRRVERVSFLLPAVIVLGVVVSGATAVYLLEREGQPAFGSIWDGLWWATVSATTTGYGDLVPHTAAGKLIAVLVILAGFGLVPAVTATAATIFVTRRLKEERGLERITEKGHTVVCGWNQDARKVLQGLAAQKSDGPSCLVMVNEQSEAAMSEILSAYPGLGLRWVRGDFSSEEVLRLANVQAAAMAIILSDTARGEAAGDQRTILATLTMKSLNSRLRVCAEVLEPGSELHLKRAGADEVITHGEHDPFLLMASAVSPGIPGVVRQLLSSAGGRLRQERIPADFRGKTFEQLAAFFREKHRSIAIGIVSEEKAIGLQDVLSADYSAVDAFIQRKFSAAGKSHLAARQTSYTVSLNPPHDYAIGDNDWAIVVGGK